MQVSQSRYLFRRMGMAGSRPGRPVRRRIEGLMASGYSFPRVRRSVIFLQRMWRQTLVKMARRRYAEEHKEELQEEMKQKTSKLKSFRMLRSRKNFGGSDVSSELRVS